VKPQRVIIPNNKNEKLVGYLYKGTSETLIIICHGLESNNVPLPPFTKEIVSEYCDYLSRKTKASVFSFDFSGFGESEGKHMVSLIKRDSEIKSVLDYFVSTYKKIFLYGNSLSGATVAIAASKYKTIRGIITINGFFTFHLSSLYKANIVLIFSLLLANPLYIKELYFLYKHLKTEKIAVPVLVVHSDKDNLVNPKQSIHFFEALQARKKIVAIASSDHGMFKEYMQGPAIVSTWFSEIYDK
jgi:pimeloyl-ACP methyl ester carboxylesterase